MEILLKKENGKIETRELKYIINGVDDAQDWLGNYENLDHDEEGIPYLTEHQYNWWKDLFQDMERIEELKEELLEEKLEEFYELEESGEFSNCDLEIEVAARLEWLEENK